MKIIDENGRLFGRISIIDVLAVVVVIFMAAALFTSQVRSTGTQVEEEFITFQVRVQGVERYVADAILVGDSVYDQGYSSGGRGIGEITAVEVEHDPGLWLTDQLGDGSQVYLEAEDTVDLLVTIKGRGTRSGRVCTLNGVYALGLNANRNLYTKRAGFVGKVCEIF